MLSGTDLHLSIYDLNTLNVELQSKGGDAVCELNLYLNTLNVELQ